MLNLSACKIQLTASSSYYARLTCLIYCSAFLLLFYSACPIGLKVVVAVYLLIKLTAILSNPIPYPQYQKLEYNKGWVLVNQLNPNKQANKSQQETYAKARVVIDVGLFFLLELQNKPMEKEKYLKSKKLMVIFLDQIDQHSYRLLKIINKIEPQN